VSINERLDRLEEIMAQLCRVAIDADLDNSWQQQYDLLHSFIAPMEKK